MSVDQDDAGDRDLEAELASPAAGQFGVPFDALCTGCKQTRVKRAPVPDWIDLEEFDPADLDDREELENATTSFKHVCHRCGSATWWNPLHLLAGLLASDLEEGDSE